MIDADGWWLRLAPTSWLIGSVLPHGRGAVERRVRAAEEFYAGHGISPRFEICAGACPDELDEVLEDRGYFEDGAMSLQITATARLKQPTDLRVTVSETPTLEWIDTLEAVLGPQTVVLGRVESPSAYASAWIGSDVVAVGRSVADTGWAGVFGMATVPHARGRGAGRAVLGALAEWAETQEAEHMYLQVERDNAPARRLYEKIGFHELASYHYRVAP